MVRWMDWLNYVRVNVTKKPKLLIPISFFFIGSGFSGGGGGGGGGCVGGMCKSIFQE